MNYSIRNIYNFNEVECNDIQKNIHIICKSTISNEYPQYLKKQIKQWSLLLDTSWTIYFWNDYALNSLKNKSDSFEKLIFEVAEKQSNAMSYIDVMKLDILWKYGGYYFDSAFEICNSIEPLSHIDADFIICNDSDAYDLYVQNAFIAIKKEHVFLNYLLEKMVESINKNENKSIDSFFIGNHLYKYEYIIKNVHPYFVGPNQSYRDIFVKHIVKLPTKYFYRNQPNDIMLEKSQFNNMVYTKVNSVFNNRFAHHIFIK